jgi:hypothetical protein
MKQGLIIARSKSRNEFFTASSSYDNPKWTSLEEATTYYSAESAEAAVKKLWMRGHFAAKIKTLAEMELEFEMPDDRDVRDDREPIVASDDPDHQDHDDHDCDRCPECGADLSDCECEDDMHVPRSSDRDSDEDIMSANDRPRGEEQFEDDERSHGLTRFTPNQTVKLHGDLSGKYIVVQDSGTGNVTISDTSGNVTTVPSHSLVKEALGLEPMVGRQGGDRAAEQKWYKGVASGEGIRVFVVIAGRKIGPMSREKAKELATAKGGKVVVESEMLPAKPQLDAKPSENKNTVLDAAKPTKIDVKDPASLDIDPASELVNEPTSKIKIPASIKSELAAAITSCQKQADKFASRDDATASFHMQCHDCMVEVQDALNVGTVEALKAVQIRMSSWMSPIINMIPSAVHKFVLGGGARPSLKDMFDTKKAAKQETK